MIVKLKLSLLSYTAVEYLPPSIVISKSIPLVLLLFSSMLAEMDIYPMPYVQTTIVQCQQIIRCNTWYSCIS